MAKTKQKYLPKKVATPKLEAGFCNIKEKSETTDRYELSVVVDDSPECQALIDTLVDFQNKCLDEDGHDAIEDPLFIKDEMSKNEKSGRWDVKTGRKLLTFHTSDKDKLQILGPDKKPISEDKIIRGATVRIVGQPAFGYFGRDPYVTLYCSVIQYISGGGTSGAELLDVEDEGDNGDVDMLDDGDVDHGDVELS